MAGFVVDGAARLLKMDGIGCPGPPGAQPGPRVRDQILRRVGGVDPRQFGMLGRLPVNWFAVPVRPGGKKPSDARLSARPAMMHHGDAPHLIGCQPYAYLFSRLAG